MGSLSQGISPLVNAWTKVGASVPFGFFTIAAATISLNLFQLVPAGILSGIKIKHSTAFAAPGLATCTVSVGIAGNLAKYAPAFDVMQATGNTILQDSGGIWCENQAAATQILLTMVATGALLNALTAGVVDIWAQVSVAN